MVEAGVADEATDGVSCGFEEGQAVAAAAFVGAIDDVVVGDGCGAWVIAGREAGGADGVVEVVQLLGVVVALGGGWGIVCG